MFNRLTECLDEERKLVVLFDEVVYLDPVRCAGTLYTGHDEMRLRLTWEEALLIVGRGVEDAAV